MPSLLASEGPETGTSLPAGLGKESLARAVGKSSPGFLFNPVPIILSPLNIESSEYSMIYHDGNANIAGVGGSKIEGAARIAAHDFPDGQRRGLKDGIETHCGLGFRDYGDYCGGWYNQGLL